MDRRDRRVQAPDWRPTLSGPHALFRTPNRPVFENKEMPNPDYAEGGDEPETITIQLPVPHPTKTRLVSVPLPAELVNDTNKGWQSLELPAQRHVLDYRPQPVAVSKHAGGRTQKLTAKQRAKRDARQQREVQARKTQALDADTFAKAART